MSSLNISTNSIGIFDSGVGGLTVLKELKKLLPSENYIYLSDNANCPYGNKSKKEVLELSKQDTEFLIKKKCKLIVVACNTATSAAIDKLRAEFSVPFVGLEPAVKPAAQNTVSGKIGILATKGTVEGDLFKQTSSKYANNVEVFVKVGEGLVEMVESNKYQSDEAKKLLASYILPMQKKGVDKIVLGCTHYPFFTPLIKEITNNSIDIINPAPAVANQTKFILEKENIVNKLGNGMVHFFSSGQLETLKQLARNILDAKEYSFEKINLYTN